MCGGGLHWCSASFASIIGVGAVALRPLRGRYTMHVHPTGFLCQGVRSGSTGLHLTATAIPLPLPLFVACMLLLLCCRHYRFTTACMLFGVDLAGSFAQLHRQQVQACAFG